MPISLCEWRVRIGRFVQWMREYEIKERKEKALKERTRLLKILHERLLKTKGDLEGKGDECETKTNNSSNGETDDQSGSEITNNSIPNDPLRNKSFPTQSPIQKSNTAPGIRANSKSNYTNSTFFNISFILSSSLLLFLIFFSVFSFSSSLDDFLDLLENSELPLDRENTSSWIYNWPILMVCSIFMILAYGVFSVLTYNEGELQGNFPIINENKIRAQCYTKENFTSNESSIKKAKTPTRTSIKGDKTPVPGAIRKKNTSAKTTIYRNKTPTKTATTGNKSPTQTTIKGDNTQSHTTIKGVKAQSQTTIKEDQTQSQTTIKRVKTQCQTTTNGDRSSTQTIIKGSKTPPKSTIRWNKSVTQTTIKREKSPIQTTTKGDKSPNENIIIESTFPNRTTIKGNKSPNQTTISGNKNPTQTTIKGDKTLSQNTIKVDGSKSRATIKGNKTPTQPKTKTENRPTQTTIKENKTLTRTTTKGYKTPTQTTITEEDSPTKTTTKEDKSATQTTALGGKSSTQTTFKREKHPIQIAITGDESPNQTTITGNKTSIQTTTKAEKNPSRIIIKEDTTPTQSKIKADAIPPTQTTVKRYNKLTQATMKMDSSRAQITINENNRGPSIKANQTSTESNTKENNNTKAKSVINGNNIPIKRTTKDENTKNESVFKDRTTATQSLIKENKIRTEFNIRENSTTDKCIGNVNHVSTEFTMNITPYTYSIRQNTNPSESIIRQNKPPIACIKAENTPMESSIKEKNTQRETILRENNSHEESTTTASNTTSEFTIRGSDSRTADPPTESTTNECTIRSGNEKIPSSLDTTTEDPILQETACPAEMLLVKAGDVELNPGPLDRVSENIQEQELVNLAYDVPPSKYTALCIALGTTYTRSQAILTQLQTDFPGSLIKVFSEWKNRQRDGTNYRNVIAEALSRANLDALGGKVIRGEYLPREPTSSGSSVNGKEPLTREEVARCPKDFKSFYRTRLCKIRTNPLDFNSILELERIYTNLVLLRNEMGTTRKTPLNYTELLTTKVNGELPKRFMLEGEGGAGKTTFCSKIAWDWANGAKEFHDFDWVLVIPLRDIQGNQTVGKIARTYLSDSNPTKPCQIEEYILANPSKVFILFDGLDEYVGDLAKQRTDIARIIRSEKFKECRVLITTRPWKAHQIKSTETFSKIYAFIAVTGFNRDHVSIYITKYFKDDKQAGDGLIKLIEGNDVIKENMAPFPLFVAMLCTLWTNSDASRRKKIQKLKTFSQLFTTMIIFLKDHYISKHCQDHTTGISTPMGEQIHSMILVIGKFALYGVLDKKFEYTENDFRGYEEAMETCCRIGVLSREIRIVPLHKRSMNVTYPVTSRIFFPHKLFQEYLAGMYLSSLFKSELAIYERDIKRVIQNAEEFRYLLYFTASQTNDVGLDIIKRIMNLPTDPDYPEYDILVDVAFEAYHEDVGKVVAQHIFKEEKSLEIHGRLSAHTVSGYLFIMEKQTMDTLILNRISCGPAVSRDLADIICSSKSLTGLMISETTFPEDFFGIIEGKIKTSKLKRLSIEMMYTPEEVQSRNLARFVNNLPGLKDLTLRANDFKECFYTELSSGTGCVAIQKLTLEGLNLERNDPSASRDLAKFLCLQPFFTDLKITSCYDRYDGFVPVWLHDEFYHEVARLASSSKILKLTLEGLNLKKNDTSASRDLATFLCLQPCLTDLRISSSYDECGNFSPVRLHDEFYHEIARLASSSKIQKLTLEELNLERNDPSASRDLATFLCLKPCLTDLRISSYDEYGNFSQSPVTLHDEFYHEIARLGSSSRIQNLTLEGLNLERNDPSASRDLATFLCLQPRLTDLRIASCVRRHDEFYHEIARLGLSLKIQNLYLEGLNLEKNDPSASRDLATFLCLQPCLTDLRISSCVCRHVEFYHEIARLALSSKIHNLTLEGLNLVWNDPSASRDLANFLCLQPCLTDLRISSYVYLHDEFYHEIARLALSSKIHNLTVEGLNLEKNDPSASRDLATFLCRQPCLTDLGISSYVWLHDEFYHEIARLASSSKIQKLTLERLNLGSNDPSASRDLATFLCLQPCLADLRISSHNVYNHDSRVWLHDEFYHEIARLASSSKIQKLTLEGLNLESNDPSSSRDLATFLCLQPCLIDLNISTDGVLPVWLHDEFYLEVDCQASSSKNPFFKNNVTWKTWYNELRKEYDPQYALHTSQTTHSGSPTESSESESLESPQQEHSSQQCHVQTETFVQSHQFQLQEPHDAQQRQYSNRLTDTDTLSDTPQSVTFPIQGSVSLYQKQMPQEVVQTVSHPSYQGFASFPPEARVQSEPLAQSYPLQQSVPQLCTEHKQEHQRSQAAFQSSHRSQVLLPCSSSQEFITTHSVYQGNAQSDSAPIQAPFRQSSQSPQLHPKQHIPSPHFPPRQQLQSLQGEWPHAVQNRVGERLPSFHSPEGRYNSVMSQSLEANQILQPWSTQAPSVYNQLVQMSALQRCQQPGQPVQNDQYLGVPFQQHQLLHPGMQSYPLTPSTSYFPQQHHPSHFSQGTHPPQINTYQAVINPNQHRARAAISSGILPSRGTNYPYQQYLQRQPRHRHFSQHPVQTPVSPIPYTSLQASGSLLQPYTEGINTHQAGMIPNQYRADISAGTFPSHAETYHYQQHQQGQPIHVSHHPVQTTALPIPYTSAQVSSGPQQPNTHLNPRHTLYHPHPRQQHPY